MKTKSNMTVKDKEKSKELIKTAFREIDNNPFIPKKPLLGFGPSVIWDKTTLKLKTLLKYL